MAYWDAKYVISRLGNSGTTAASTTVTADSENEAIEKVKDLLCMVFR